MLLVRLSQRDDRRSGRILGHDHRVVGNLLRLVKDAGDGDGFLDLLVLGRINDRSDVSVRERVCVDDGFGRRVASFVFHGGTAQTADWKREESEQRQDTESCNADGLSALAGHTTLHTPLFNSLCFLLFGEEGDSNGDEIL